MAHRRGFSWIYRAITRWSNWSPQRKVYSLVGLSLLALLLVFSFLLRSGIASAFQARDQFKGLETELSHLGPVDLLKVETYRSLSGQFREAEQATGRARSRLRPAGLFTWVPLLGGRIREARTQLEMAYFLSRAGRNLATAYQGALELPLGQLDEEEASKRVTEALEKAAPQLVQVERDLQRARRLLSKSGPTGLDSRYVSLLDKFLPQIQTVAYISRVTPEVIGQSYVLNRELSAVGDLANDPLQVLSSPEKVDRSLAVIVDRSQRLAVVLEQMRQAVKENVTDPPEVREEVLKVTQQMKQGVSLLEHATAGARGLLALARAAEEHGFLSKDFGVAAKAALDEAEARLALARGESAALRPLLAGQSSNPGSPSSLPLGKTTISFTSVARLEVLLDRVFESTRFLQSFLGFQGPRTYLLLGQNQQEIRATGGFIGVAVQVTLDQGKLAKLEYHDSTTVDPLPPRYPNNPLPPEPLYWYLWMGRLLFRDSNWSPNFPSSAAQIADLYGLGRGVAVDGVITGSKALVVDMVGLLGDIRVPGSQKPLTRETATAYTDGDLPYACTPRHISDRGKRCFDEDIFFAFRDRLGSSMSAQERVALVKLFKSALDRGNILIHVFNPEEGSLLWEMGWNGAIRRVDHDYLLVVDSSLPGHTAEGTRRHWEYQVSLQMGKPATARLRVRYDREGVRRKDRVCRQSEPGLYACYWNYFRVYLPQAATGIKRPQVPLHEGAEKLIWGYWGSQEADSGSLVREADVGPARLTEVGGFIAVEPGSVTTIPLEYQLPWEMILATGQGSFEYRLLLQKQPGMEQDRISVAVELPLGTEVLKTSPESAGRSGGWVTFDFDLDSDKEVVVAFRASGGG